MKFLVSLGLLALTSVTVLGKPQFPNYITPEEFAAARLNPIVVSNVPVPLSPRGHDILPSPRPGFGPRLWTNAEVPYTLDPNFTAQQREDVAKALDAFHKDTCIRFIPKTVDHGSWVDILYDETVCGVAHVCMNTGAQFAKFGGTCVNPGTMVHELGHTLCMGHEQTRLDRDEWIDWDEDVCEPHGLDGSDFDRGLHKFYDYVGIEHYEGECYNGCILPKKDNVTKCGSGGPLSVLDIEILNEMYGCQGCSSYRFINPTKGSLENPVSAGMNADGSPLYICRAYQGGDIVTGRFNNIAKECYVTHNGETYTHSGAEIEVLCNPNNLEFQWINAETPPSNAIRGGRTNERETIYIVRCPIVVGPFTLTFPGKYTASTGAFIAYGGEYKCENYDFIVCN